METIFSHRIIKPNFSFFANLSTSDAQVILGFMELLVLLQLGTFPIEESAIRGLTSGQRSMEWSAILLGETTISTNFTKTASEWL